MKKTLLFALFLSFFYTSSIFGEVRFPPKPGQFDFISDNANLLSPSDKKEMKSNLRKLLKEKAIPIIVVTIRSIRQYMGYATRGEMPIQEYARQLFNRWGIGHQYVTVRGRGIGRSAKVSWNKGILLLISIEDRKARIELGADFGFTKDKLCTQIMEQNIVPYFRNGDYPSGIKSGVMALDKMARGEKIPVPPRPWWHYLLVLVAMGLTIFTIVSLTKQGASGWAWIFWSLVFATIWWIIWTMLTSKNSGGSFGGGSFGGGFSGGGGASGSW